MSASKQEETFCKIAQSAIRSAEKVDCPLEDFACGLTTMIDVLQERLRDLEDEL